mgnify:CR=1 FL=1
MTTLVGQKIPDLTVKALMPGGEFRDLRLTEYGGKWLVLFFYPLDFTFV